MADLTLIKQQKHQKGRPRGCRDKSNRAAELLLDGEAEALTRKAVELALDGDASALRLCLDRVVAPRRERAVHFTMPAIRGPADLADLAGAMGALAGAAAQGAITPGEAAHLCQIIETLARAIETTEFDRRLRQIEATPVAVY